MQRVDVYNKKRSYLYNFKHLHACYLAVSIQIIHIKGPVKFLLKASSRGDGQSTDKLPEVNCAITIFIKGAKGMLSKFGGITIGEEL